MSSDQYPSTCCGSSSSCRFTSLKFFCLFLVVFSLSLFLFSRFLFSSCHISRSLFQFLSASIVYPHWLISVLYFAFFLMINLLYFPFVSLLNYLYSCISSAPIVTDIYLASRYLYSPAVFLSFRSTIQKSVEKASNSNTWRAISIYNATLPHRVDYRRPSLIIKHTFLNSVYSLTTFLAWLFYLFVIPHDFRVICESVVLQAVIHSDIILPYLSLTHGWNTNMALF